MLRYDSHDIIDHLQEAAFHRKATIARTLSPQAQLAFPEERDHRGVTRENADLPIERRRDDRIALAFEQHGFR